MSRIEKRERKADDIEEAESPPPAKRQACNDCTSRALDHPDVTVFVDGKEFHLHGTVLCLASRYFRSALAGDMKEATTRRFEFPDRDAETFELLMNIIAPCSSVRETPADKIQGVLDWSDFLCLEFLPVHCDEAYRDVVLEWVNATSAGIEESAETFSAALLGDFHHLINALQLSRRIHLKLTQFLILSSLRRVLRATPSMLDATHIQGLLSLCNNDEEFAEEIWPHLSLYVPKVFKTCGLKDLVVHEYLPALMVDEIDRQEKTQAIEDLQEVLWKPLNKRSFNNRLYDEIATSFSNHQFWRNNSDRTRTIRIS